MKLVNKILDKHVDSKIHNNFYLQEHLVNGNKISFRKEVFKIL